ncbi:MAG: DUF853 family protein [Myxococcales bacterium]|nr:DUF853 family protein [Myxococcales bacterium]
MRELPRAQAISVLSEGLSGSRAPLLVLAQLALLDDCLRVAALAIDADGHEALTELASVAALVDLAAHKYFTLLPRYETFDEGASAAREVKRFFEVYRGDDGAFGHLDPTPWRGIALVQTVERTTHNASPLRDHEHMLARIMEGVFEGRAGTTEATARRKLRARFEPPPLLGPDPRAVAFCRPDGPEVFSTVAHGSQIHVRDPFDVESIHAEARAIFHRHVERATTPSQHQLGHGRTLLILGESGSGKTHLLRALRHQLHAQRRGYAGYLQMSTEAGDYTRYVLRNFIDSLEQPYDAPALSDSGLLCLSTGLVEGSVEHPAEELVALRTSDQLSGEALHELVSGMVDRILRTEHLQGLEPALLHVLLLLQRRDAAIQRRVIQFLRCEPLTAHEQRLLGGQAPRLHADDPMRTLRQLAAIAFELQLAAMVLLVDQVEDAVPDGAGASNLQQAFDVLRALADAIPSAVVVVTCLDDVYSRVRPRLSQPLVDRLEREPPLQLAHQRLRPEIEEMLIRRLDHLYATFEVAWRDDDPVYPFAPAQLDAVLHFRSRDCLAMAQRFHRACIAAGRLLDATDARDPAGAPVGEPGHSQPGQAASDAREGTTPGEGHEDLDKASPIDQLWNDAVVAADTIGDGDDRALLSLVDEALREACAEQNIDVTLSPGVRDGVAQLLVDVPGLPRRVLEVCDRGPQGGHLAAHLHDLTTLARTGVVAVALRRSGFEFGARSLTSRRVGELTAAGGVPVTVQERELRAVMAARTVSRADLPGFASWKRRTRPMSRLALTRAVLGLDGPGGVPRRQQTLTGLADPVFTRPPAPEPDDNGGDSGGDKGADNAPPTSTGVAAVPPREEAAQATQLPPEPASAEAARAARAARTSGQPPTVPFPARPARSATEDERTADAARPAPAAPASAVRIGVTATLRADPVYLPIEQMKTHVAFLGGTGSGKTTAALAVIERLLEAGVSALLVDRKGDLARYASEAWWNEELADPAQRQRRRDLRARIDVSLYTPGQASGRPLRLPVVPSLARANQHDRDQLATFSASSLAAMMGYGRGTTMTHKQSVLKRAIELQADEDEITVEMLHSCVSFPDPELLSSVGALKRFFAPLAEDLQSLLIQRGALLAGTGEALDLDTLLPPPEHGRARLTIIHTGGLGDAAMLQFWVSRLLVELDRLAARRPRSVLQAVTFFDEADVYLPATSQPATKDPMFALLRRARARGLGVLLATQSPGDLDYKARENILTWLVGKISQERALEKMGALLGDYPSVANRLASQAMGHFFLLGGLAGRTAAEIRTDRSMMVTEPMSEAEVCALANQSAAAARRGT